MITDVTVVDVVHEKFLPHQFILVRGENIEGITARPPTAACDRTIDGTNLIALPGFINTHTRLWQHVAKSVAPSGMLQEWIPRVGQCVVSSIYDSPNRRATPPK